ncbi:porin [Paraburkholderia sediminicola]|uniref:porin n=1 Tax=Paraburkholderia sediminicola TaxID=458836 RepID=UPI0038B70943
MKRMTVLALLLTLNGIAHAQSSVTLYGRLDNGVQFQSGLPKGHLFGVESGYLAPSIFGLMGGEDLGGGTKVVFKLEAGVNTMNGASIGGLFSRTATMGFKNDQWGEFRFGRLGITEIQENAYFIDPQSFWIYSISTLVRGRNWTAAGNGFEYTSPNMGGLILKGQYDLSNNTSWNAGNPGSGPSLFGQPQGRSDGLMAQYNAAGLQLEVIYDEIRDPAGQFSNVYSASRSILAGATYTFGDFRFCAGYQHLSAPNASSEGYFGSQPPTVLPSGASLPTAVNHEWVGVDWQASSVTSVTAAVYHANANKGNGNATLFTLAAAHNLSKRTLLYAELGYVRNSTTSNIGLDGGFGDPYGANVNDDPVNGGTNTNPNYGHGQFGVTVGLLTQF